MSFWDRHRVLSQVMRGRFSAAVTSLYSGSLCIRVKTAFSPLPPVCCRVIQGPGEPLSKLPACLQLSYSMSQDVLRHPDVTRRCLGLNGSARRRIAMRFRSLHLKRGVVPRRGEWMYNQVAGVCLLWHLKVVVLLEVKITEVIRICCVFSYIRFTLQSSASVSFSRGHDEEPRALIRLPFDVQPVRLWGGFDCLLPPPSYVSQ